MDHVARNLPSEHAEYIAVDPDGENRDELGCASGCHESLDSSDVGVTLWRTGDTIQFDRKDSEFRRNKSLLDFIPKRYISSASPIIYIDENAQAHNYLEPLTPAQEEEEDEENKEDVPFRHLHIDEDDGLHDFPRGGSDPEMREADVEQSTSDDLLKEPTESSSTVLNLTPRPLEERHRLEFATIVCGGIALSFNSGFVNGITLQFNSIPVTHITGTSSWAGINLGQGQYTAFGLDIALICSFMMGCTMTGMVIRCSSFHLGRRYGPLFVVGSLLFLLAMILSYIDPHSRLYFYFAAMGAGLQNAMMTRYSGNVIRTSHLSGCDTDIGLILGRWIMGDYHESWKLKLLLPLVISFIIGGCCSVFAFESWGRRALAVNVIVFLCIGIAYSILIGNRLHIPAWKVLFGLYEQLEVTVVSSRRRLSKVAKRTKRRIGKIVRLGSPVHHHRR